MTRNDYHPAGVAAFAAAALTLPMMATGIALDIVSGAHPMLLAAYGFTAVGQTLCGVYALYRFRHLLNRTFGFHDTDRLISFILAGALLLAAIMVPARLLLGSAALPREAAVYFTAAVLVIGLPLAILSVAFAMRLRRVEGDTTGHLRPFANLTLAASLCFATFILAPVGLILDALASVWLGMMFMHAGPRMAMPDFV